MKDENKKSSPPQGEKTNKKKPRKLAGLFAAEEATANDLAVQQIKSQIIKYLSDQPH
ncbi:MULTISPECIES: hypothetical protein [Prochlorococcus]|uniref:hypothetical protein n=1 Tax=Prochlorococcus TaxID=1218 RepID=UPI000AAA9A79|nr:MULTISPECIES: hypothetical protein [Prochlorococcus]NMP05909.1 hypothetical protein [Prochlorococcus sp. P1361]NMP12935.1 hypothetical protein [Prochlorococcus sp.P1363]